MTLEEITDLAAKARAAGDRDPEMSHIYTDDVVEDALKAIAEDFIDPIARIKVAIAVQLLQDAEQWGKWYA